MSWHGPSAPRVEGMATKSAVVASCASKEASTASRIRCWVSALILVSCPSPAVALRIDQGTSGGAFGRPGPLSESQTCPYNSSQHLAERPDGGQPGVGQQEHALSHHW